MVQQEMTLFKFLPQDNKTHQEEQAPGPAPQTAAVPQAALNAFCQSHTCIPTLRLKARAQLLPQDRSFTKHAQRKSLNSPHATCESAEAAPSVTY